MDRAEEGTYRCPDSVARAAPLSREYTPEEPALGFQVLPMSEWGMR